LKTQDLARLVLVPVWSQFANLFAFRPTPDPVFGNISHSSSGGTPRAFAHTRAVVIAVVMFSPFRETRDEDTSFPYTCRSPFVIADRAQIEASQAWDNWVVLEIWPMMVVLRTRTVQVGWHRP
jgi:hypothetical protein